MRYRTQLILSLFLSLSTIGSGQIFDGGQGDGSDINRLDGTTLAGDTLSVIYAGGFGDGSDIHGLASTTLDGLSLTVVFSGGRGDGYDTASAFTTLAGLNLAALYAGGSGDGYDSLLASSFTLGETTRFDFDMDGIPDDWELLYQTVLNPKDPNDAGIDSDGDGFLNIEEYEANTKPDDPSSFFYARIAEKLSGGYEILFNTSADRYYRLQLSTDLSAFPAVTAPVQGTGAEMSEDLPAGDKVFGRIEVQVSP